ncbi:hypothetical protein NC651_039190 [Populus alba x Populus x berolinensis]|nr:hypothetical protein NC651_039190 [Populus alba x Populus x berolinensis]
MVMEGWLTKVTFFPSTSVFRSLLLCSCFSLHVFSLFSFSFCFLLFPLSLSVLVPLGLSLYYPCLFISFVLYVRGSPLLCGLSLFVPVSQGLYLVGWINNLR